MAIKEISVTLINKQRRVDCLAAIGPPFSYQTVPSAPLFSQRHKVIQPYILGLKQQKPRKGGAKMLVSPTQFAREIGIEAALARELMKFMEIEPVTVSPQKVRLFNAGDLELVFQKLEILKEEVLRELKNSKKS